MFVIGDWVKVTEYSDKRYIGNRGEVIFIGTETADPHCIIKLDTGKVLFNLQEQQLHKMEGDELSKAKGRKEKEKIKNQVKEKKQDAAKGKPTT